VWNSQATPPRRLDGSVFPRNAIVAGVQSPTRGDVALAVFRPQVLRGTVAWMRQQDPVATPAEQRLFADIAEHGVHIVHEAEHGERPVFAYTVGMWHSFGQPEIIVIGLPREVAQDLLDNLADEVDGGRRFGAGEQHGGLVRDYPVRLLRVNDAQAAQWLPLVGWAYERSDVPCLQLVYPDKQGRWPWQPDVRDGFRRIQPVLERAAESS